jgi:hypothetical protein
MNMIVPLLSSQIKLISELVEGPCNPNIRLIFKYPFYFPYFGLIMRLISDLDHSFYELKHLLLKFTSILVLANRDSGKE